MGSRLRFSDFAPTLVFAFLTSHPLQRSPPRFRPQCLTSPPRLRCRRLEKRPTSLGNPGSTPDLASRVPDVTFASRRVASPTSPSTQDFAPRCPALNSRLRLSDPVGAVMISTPSNSQRSVRGRELGESGVENCMRRADVVMMMPFLVCDAKLCRPPSTSLCWTSGLRSEPAREAPTMLMRCSAVTKIEARHGGGADDADALPKSQHSTH